MACEIQVPKPTTPRPPRNPPDTSATFEDEVLQIIEQLYLYTYNIYIYIYILYICIHVVIQYHCITFPPHNPKVNNQCKKGVNKTTCPPALRGSGGP